MKEKHIGNYIEKCCLFLLGMIIVFLINSYFQKSDNKIEIVGLPEKNELSSDVGVRIAEIKIDGETIDFSKLDLSDGWNITEDGMLAFYNDLESEALSIPCTGKELVISFLQQNCLGKMKVIVDNNTNIIDTYANTEWNVSKVEIDRNSGKSNNKILNIIIISIAIFSALGILRSVLDNKYIECPYWLRAFIVNVIIASIAIVPFIIIGNGYFALSNDFIAETIPFGMFINNAYKKGDILWNFNIDIGSNFIEALQGYNSSPFLILQLIFPAEKFPKVIGWIIIIKYGVAGLTSSLYLKKYIKNENILILGTLLYTFSSYNCSTIVFQFQDMVAIFPLVIYTLELLVERGNILPFCFAIFLSSLVGFTNFFMTVWFVIIYYLVKYIFPNIKNGSLISQGYLIKTLKCLLGGLTGFLLSSFFTIPAIVNLLGNQRAASKINFLDWFTISTTNWLMDIKALFLPAEPMNHSFSITDSDWMSNYAYLPMFGCSLVIAYLWFAKKNDWLKNILIVLFLFALFPVLNSSFYFFSNGPYRRWYHMLLLIMVLATVKVLDKPEVLAIKKGINISIFVVLLFAVICTGITLNKNLNISLIIEKKCFWYSVIYALAGLILVKYVLVHSIKFDRCIMLITALFSAVQLGMSINQYQSYVDNTGKNFNAFEFSYSEAAVNYLTDVAAQLNNDVEEYRYYFDEGIGNTYYNFGMTNNLPTINSFISTLSNSIIDFYDSLGIGRGTMTIMGQSELLSLLSVKYIIAEDEFYDYPIIEQIENHNGQIFNLIENPYALQMGIVYDSYINKSEFYNIDSDKRVLVMLHSLVVDDEDEYMVVDRLKKYSYNDLNDLSADSIYEIINEKKNSSLGTFAKGRNSFSSEIYSDGNNYIFYSIPYEKWWKATVNGNTTEILNINGLMAVALEEGSNNVHFEYDYVPIKIGIVATIIGFIFLSLIWLREYVIKNKSL